MSSSEDSVPLAPEFGQSLLALAGGAIEAGLDGARLQIALGDYPPALREARASFVTLNLDGRLRGCIGSLLAHRALVEDVAANAFMAAFQDPRFPPVNRNEFARVDISLSILSPPQPMRFASEDDLRRQVRPGVDGLILSAGNRRGTFLPSVWEQLSDPADFLRQLKVKAGLSADYWSSEIQVQRYTAQSIR